MKYLFLFFIVQVISAFPALATGFFDVPTPDSDIGSLKQGTRFIGMNVSVSERTSENPSSLFEQIESVDNVSFTLSGSGGYFIRDLWMMGGKLEYEYSEKDTGFTEETEKKRVQAVSRSTTLGYVMRNYLPIGDGGRFSLFVESGVDFGYGKEVIQTTLDDNIDRKVAESYLLNIGVTPGLMAFVDKGVAVEASVNVMGLTAKWGDYDFNAGERTGNTSSVDLDFSIKLLTLYIGVTCYF